MSLPDTTPVADLDLPVRVRAALIRAGFFQLGQLRPLQADTLGFIHIRGIGYKGDMDILSLLHTIDDEDAYDRTVMDEDMVPLAPPSRYERRNVLEKFVEWFLEHEEGLLLFYDEPAGRREVYTDADIKFLLDKFEDWEVDQAVAEAERRAEGA